MSAKTNKRPSPAARARRPAAARRGNRWLFPAVLAVVVLVGIVAVVLVAAGGDGDDDGGGSAIQLAAEVSVDGDELPELPSSGQDPAVGQPAPTLGSVNFAGGDVQVGGATGQPYALVFLAHWCPHCQNEVPVLVDLAENRQIEGVDVIGVATGTSEAQPNYPPSAWLEREDWPFPVLVDDADRTAAAAYGLSGYPFMVFVDAQGEIVGRTSGERGEDQLRAIFSALAAGETLPLAGAGPSSDG